MTYTSYALWGRGDVTPQNASALLADYLTGQVGAIYRPVDVPRGGLRTAVNFLETPEMYGDGGTIESEDIETDLLKCAQDEGDDVELIVLWPSDPTQEEINFVHDLWVVGVKVVNLSGGLDELDVENLEAVVPEPVKKTRASRKLSDPKSVAEDMGTTSPATPELQAAFDAEVSKVRDDPPWVTDAQELVVQTEPLDPDGPIELESCLPADDFVVEGNFEIKVEPYQSAELVADTMVAVSMREMIRQEIYSILKAEGVLPGEKVDTIDELKAEVARLRDEEIARAGKPQVMGMDYDNPKVVDHVTAQMMKQFTDHAGTVDYYMSQDGNYRLAAQGLPRRGEQLVQLTSGEVNQLAQGGRIR